MEGFMTTEWCAEQGMFRDCRMESIVCGEGGCYKHWEFGDKEKMNLVLYVHDDMKAYKVKPTKEFNIPEFLETSINRNAVTVKGSYDEATNTILATSFEAPPPPKKSFFKGRGRRHRVRRISSSGRRSARKRPDLPLPVLRPKQCPRRG